MLYKFIFLSTLFSVAMRWLLQIVLSNVYLCAGAKFSFLKSAKAHRKKNKMGGLWIPAARIMSYHFLFQLLGLFFSAEAEI